MKEKIQKKKKDLKMEMPDDYLHSINYFIYYNNLNPPNPLLPKPLYKPKK